MIFWTQERIIGSIQLWAQENGKPPRLIDFEVEDYRFPCTSVVLRRFESWNTALKAAGFTPRERGPGHPNGWVREAA